MRIMKSRATFSLAFWAHTSRVINELVPIYARITVNGKRSNISLHRRIPLNSWDSNKGGMKGYSQQSKAFNKYLQQIRARIYECYESLLSEDKLITSDLIKSRFLGEDYTKKTLLELFDYHNDISKEKLNKHTLKCSLP